MEISGASGKVGLDSRSKNSSWGCWYFLGEGILRLRFFFAFGRKEQCSLSMTEPGMDAMALNSLLLTASSWRALRATPDEGRRGHTRKTLDIFQPPVVPSCLHFDEPTADGIKQ
jgi:hypothetical protein